MNTFEPPAAFRAKVMREPGLSARDGMAIGTVASRGSRPACGAVARLYTFAPRSRSALTMTETLDRLIAAAAIIGDSSSPVKG